MANDIGMIKPILTVRMQTNPSAPPGRTEREAEARTDANAAQTEKESLDNVVSGLNDLVRELHRELKFSVDQESGETVIRVIDPVTDEVVRQIPSEELVQLRKRLEEAAGVFFRDSA